MYFFFQAEDGIRFHCVTGVQTCALPIYAAKGRSRYSLVCGEHAVLGNLAELAGFTLARWMTWDGIRAFDYLLTRPEVKGDRISITGTSGGGFQSLWVGALDERVHVIAPSCFVTSL